MCSPNRLDAPLLLYVACCNNVMHASHLISHRNRSMHWEENPPALDQGHRRVLITIRCGADGFVGYLHQERCWYELSSA